MGTTFTDAYNVGLNYLMDKYPQYVHKEIKNPVYKKGKLISGNEQKSMYLANVISDASIDNDDKVIALNVRDYYLAQSVKKDLKDCLRLKGINCEI